MKNYREKITTQLKGSPLPAHDSFDRSAAAVLVPVLEQSEPMVVLTKRADHLSSHAGQVSFPGGHWEKTDRDLIHTALREAQEEIGLDPTLVHVSGVLPSHETGGSQPIVPIVGLVKADAPLSANLDEVANIFFVPLRYLMDLENYERHEHEWQGKMWDYYSTNWEGYKIWGATANILHSFYDKVFQEG